MGQVVYVDFKDRVSSAYDEALAAWALYRYEDHNDDREKWDSRLTDYMTALMRYSEVSGQSFAEIFGWGEV